MYHSITLSLMDDYQHDLGADPADYIAKAAQYGDDVQRDLILLIAHHLQLTGHPPAQPTRTLLAADLDALRALDPDD